MSGSLEQRAARFPSPPRWMVKYITRINVAVYRRSGGRYGSVARNMRHLLLTTVGRRSGQQHTVALPYWLDQQGTRIVVASYGGGPHHPAWFHNLSDRAVNPTVTVQDRAELFEAVPEVLEGAERATTWEALLVDRPFYADYQAKTDRTIPLVRLTPA